MEIALPVRRSPQTASHGSEISPLAVQRSVLVNGVIDPGPGDSQADGGHSGQSLASLEQRLRHQSLLHLTRPHSPRNPGSLGVTNPS